MAGRLVLRETECFQPSVFSVFELGNRKERVMGIMSNKVTRRIALGSIAGGLGGAALVLRALKGRYEVAVPEGSDPGNAAENYYRNVRPATFEPKEPGSYAEEWNQVYRATNVSIKTSDVLSSPTLRFTAQAGVDFRVISVSASYDQRRSHDAQYPQPPARYSVTKGQVLSIQPIDDSRLALLIRAEQMSTISQTSQRELPGGKCVIVPYDFTRDYYELVGDTPRKVARSKVNIPCALLGAYLTFRYPAGTALSLGAKWTNPKTSDSSDGSLACEVEGFAEVAGKQTVTIRGEKQVSYKPAPAVLLRTGSQKHTQKELDEQAEQLLRKIKEEQPALATEGVHKVAYLDLATGLTLRQELTVVDAHTTTVTVTQVLDA